MSVCNLSQRLGQSTRRGEELGFALGKALRFLIPANYQPIEAAAVARPLLSALPSGKGKKVLLSGAMQREAFRPQLFSTSNASISYAGVPRARADRQGTE